MTIRQDIIATLAYFDLFDYPLTGAEIIQYARGGFSPNEVKATLRSLLMEKQVYHFNGLFLLRNAPDLVTRRRAGNERARKLMETARKVARLLAAFPFVRAVGVSGSLSKNWADENSDIDLFIITAPGRLWIARTLLHGLKKISYLAGRQHWFCMNYFIDETALEIREKNIYTATEVATLLPLQGREAFDAFFRANDWRRQFLPGAQLRVSQEERPARAPFKRYFEWCLNRIAPRRLDALLMRITSKRWSVKTEQGRRNSRGVVLSMEAAPNYAKPDPRRFQQRLLLRYEERLRSLETPALRLHIPAL